VLAVPWTAFHSFVGTLQAARHPLVANLGPYSGLLAPGGLHPELLAQGFMAASADPSRLLALNRALLQLTLTARQMGRAWPLRAVSARAHIRERLKAAFGAGGFEVEFAGPVATREVVPRADDTRFVLRHAGRTITRDEIPMIEYGLPVEDLEGTLVLSRSRLSNQTTRETTVELCSLIRV